MNLIPWNAPMLQLVHNLLECSLCHEQHLDLHHLEGVFMTEAATIKDQIERAVAGRYSDWQIGLTNDPRATRAKLGNPLSMVQWKAKSAAAAGRIVEHFVKLGMRRSVTNSKGSFVYILLAEATS